MLGFDFVGRVVFSLSQVGRGLATVFKHSFRQPITQSYPDVMPETHIRGRLGLTVNPETGEHLCISCRQCERVCPDKCIEITAHKSPETNKLELIDFKIDHGLCMFCGLCTEVCPTYCIINTNDFEMSDYSREALVYDLKKLTLSQEESAHYFERLELPIPKPKPAKAAAPAAAAKPADAAAAKPADAAAAKPADAAAAKPEEAAKDKSEPATKPDAKDKTAREPADKAKAETKESSGDQSSKDVDISDEGKAKSEGKGTIDKPRSDTGLIDSLSMGKIIAAEEAKKWEEEQKKKKAEESEKKEKPEG